MQVVLSTTIMLVNLFVPIRQVTVSIAIMELKAFMQHLCRWKFLQQICVTIFIEIMYMGVPVAIMLVVFSAVHYAHDYFYCNYTGGYFWPIF